MKEFDCYRYLARCVLRQALKDAQKQSNQAIVSSVEAFAKGDNLDWWCLIAEVNAEAYRKELAKAYRKGKRELKLKRIKSKEIIRTLGVKS